MSHYEERLEQDLGKIREQIAAMAGKVEEGLKNAVRALQTGDCKLASTVILADHPINRSMREIDRLCHAFIAVHLPSAGHLRLLSSAVRPSPKDPWLCVTGLLQFCSFRREHINLFIIISKLHKCNRFSPK